MRHAHQYMSDWMFSRIITRDSQEYDRCKTCAILTTLECSDIGALRIQNVCNSDATSIAIDIYIKCSRICTCVSYFSVYNENRKLFVTFNTEIYIYIRTLYVEKICSLHIKYEIIINKKEKLINFTVQRALKLWKYNFTMNYPILPDHWTV